MNLRIITLLILSGIFYQVHAMDNGLAAENMETGTFSHIGHTVKEWFAQAQLEDETIKGGIPGIRYMTHFHGGKCIITGVVIGGGYLLYRNYKKEHRATEKLKHTQEEAAPTDEHTMPFPKKELKNTVSKMLSYAFAQISQLSHWIK